MKFNDPEVVESLCWQMRQADYPRGNNRALINNLFNGMPPYTEREEEENEIKINVNFLETTSMSHEARSQFYQSVMKPGNYFSCKTDSGPIHKRREWGIIRTEEMNRPMKKSIIYTETMRSKIALNVLHGISPAGWRDEQRWCPYSMGIEDVLVPGNTLLTMENLPFFAIYRQMTAPEMIKLTQARVLDPAWNPEMLKAAIQWVDKEAQTLMYNNWPEVWAPEKVAELMKGDGGFYYGDQVPTVNVFDFYFWNDSNKVSGWNRRMVLDAWSMPEYGQVGDTKVQPTRRKGDLFEKYKRKFLYNPGDRKICQDRSEIINWQFADLSAVAPFRYHSVRSLGFLLYSIGHLQNRLRCKFNEAVFEQLMIYFRVNSEADMQRALKVDMMNRGFIDDSVKFIPPGERYQVNAQLAQMGLMQNQQIIQQNTASYTKQQDYSQNNVEKTKFQVMAEESAVNALVSAGLAQAYMYQTFEYREIARRFSIRDSVDPDVRRFQANCLRRGISEKVLYNPECWQEEPERVLGAGNKAMEMAITQQMMQYRNLYDPEPQRQILRDFTLAVTEDPARAASMVPENPVRITDSVHDAQLAAGTLMMGLPVAIKTGMNHIEYVDTLLATLATLVNQARQQGVPTQDKLMGMMNIAGHIQQHVQLIAQDPNEAQRVKQYGDALGKIGNVLKGFQQQLAQQAEAQAQQQGGNPEEAVKIQSMMQQAKVKEENAKTAHAQRTAQRQIQFEREEVRKDQKTQADIQRENMKGIAALKTETLKAGVKVASERAAARAKKVDSGSPSD